MNKSKKLLEQKIFYSFLIFALCFTSSRAQNDSNLSLVEPTTSTNKNFNANIVTQIDGSIRSIFQDKNGNFWFGTNAAGVFRYDGRTLLQFTEKDGLYNNQVQSIQEDKLGTIWFGTGLFGVSSFDGKTFTTHTNNEKYYLNKDYNFEWKIEPNDLWFYAGGGAFRYNGSLLSYLPFTKPDFNGVNPQVSPFKLSRNSVYCILKDKKGNLWFGTQSQGVCRYDGKTFTWFTDKGLSGPAVLGLFEDSKGNLWFGNNGAGLFRFDGKTLVNFTEEKNLSNNEFRVAGKSGPSTLSRIYSINEDNNGNLWIGTVDAGVWRYDGTVLTNYTTSDGLTSNAVNIIYKDKKGELWFGTDENGICKFNGNGFSKFEVK